MPRPSRWPREVKVYLTTAQEEALRSLAIREGLTVSEVARRAVERELAGTRNTVKNRRRD